MLLPHGPCSFHGIGAAIRRHRVTSAWLTSGLFRAMVDEAIEELDPLKQLLTGGDVVPVAQASRILTRNPHLRLVNGYGPTENTTFTCCHRITPEDCERDALPIGKPITGTTVQILSESGAPCPNGVAGELCAGGDGLALGYLGQPERTTERFVEHPELGRMFRTGDLCRVGPDGNLEFLGRLDAQVKIRGFRVEPGEIEAVLRTHPGVREAAVVAVRNPGGDIRLAAFVAPAETDIGDVRAFLDSRLPQHMVPGEIVALPDLPLTANGKLDRRQLAELVKKPADSAPAMAGAGQTADGMEARVRAIWTALLGSASLDNNAGFFACGGDSILLARLHARLSEITPLTMAEMFEYGTIRSQAARLAGAKPSATGLSPRQRAALARGKEARK